MQWTAPPAGSKSLILLVTDPDAPYGMDHEGNGNFYHWGLYNLAPAAGSLQENVGDDLPGGAVAVTNDAETRDFHPPCPPTGEHRYVFTIYALDKRYSLGQDASAENIHDMLEDGYSAESRHVLAKASLVSRYRH